MFPSLNLTQAVNKAQEAITGVPDTLEGVSQAATRLGINREFVQKVYSKYGNTPQARMICGMLGTTPEALKTDAERVVGSSGMAQPATSGNTTKKFPRLK